MKDLAHNEKVAATKMIFKGYKKAINFALHELEASKSVNKRLGEIHKEQIDALNKEMIEAQELFLYQFKESVERHEKKYWSLYENYEDLRSQLEDAKNVISVQEEKLDKQPPKLLFSSLSNEEQQQIKKLIDDIPEYHNHSEVACLIEYLETLIK